MNEQTPCPPESRFLVWTDHTVAHMSHGTFNHATWFWSASGPRGHMSGAEGSPDAARNRAYAAYALLEGQKR